MMGMDRREFIKLGGLAAAVGLGSSLIIGGNGAVEASGGGHGAPKEEAESTVRWGMVVDTSYFDDDNKYNRCVDACHSIHNVPTGLMGTKNEIKWIWRTPFENAFPSKHHQFQSDSKRDVLVLCNHCENPPCVRVCPTKATFKRKSDGLVLMDFHRCIGCRFCMAACPYGARSFNYFNPRPHISAIVKDEVTQKTFPTRERGVVEKCNFCAERLAKGGMPACASASEGVGMIFGNLKDENSEIREYLRRNNTITRKSELGTNPSVFFKV